MKLQRILALTTALLLLCGFQSLNASDAHLYRISLQGHGTAVELAQAGIDILAAIPNDHALAELSDEQMSRVIRLGYQVEYLAASLVAYSELDETDDYYSYASLVAQLQTWANQYANIAVLYDLATTVQNRHVYGMKISDNPLSEEDEIVNFFVGCHHGNEKISEEVPMYFLNYILSNYGTNPDVTFWVDNREIWVIPLVNPDGFFNNNRYNANNVDINRNYSFHWGQSASNYGPYPFSEVETQAVRNLNLAHHFTTAHSYHSYGEEILYPFAWAANHPSPDNPFFVEMTNAMAAYNGYTPMLSGNLYPHGGEMNDYLYGEKGVFGCTSEVWGGPGYNPPASQIAAVCQENLPTDLYQLQRSGGAQITGRITDATTGLPLVAQFKVVQLWNPNEIYPRYSEPTFGRYRHLLVPATYTLEVSKAGYATQTIPNLVVVANTPTVRDVALVFVGYPNIDIVLTPVNPPIVIPAGGGSFSYNVNIHNGESTSQSFAAWIMAELPSGTMLGPLLGPVNLTLASGATLLRTRNQSVPGSAPSGVYTYIGYVGAYPDAKYDSSYFNFTKSAADNGSSWVNDFANTGEPFEVDQMAQSPAQFALLRNFPNPFNASTTIRFQLPEASLVKLDVYDVSGRWVSTLVDGWREAGSHEVAFDGSNLASGVYIYYLTAGQFNASGKMVLMK